MAFSGKSFTNHFPPAPASVPCQPEYGFLNERQGSLVGLLPGVDRCTGAIGSLQTAAQRYFGAACTTPSAGKAVDPNVAHYNVPLVKS